MARIFGHYMSLELLVLGLIESALSFFIIYLLLVASGASVAPLDITPAGINLAVVLVLAISLTASAIGLYRLDTLLQPRRLLVNTVVAGLLASPVILVVAEVFHANGLLWLARILLAWLLCLFVTRLIFRLALRRHLFTRRIVVIGSGQGAGHTGAALASQGGAFFEIASVIPVGSSTPILPETLRRQKIWGIVITPDARGKVPTDQLLRCKSAGIRIIGDVEFRERQLRRIDLDRLIGDWLVFAEGAFAGRIDRALKRGFDVIVSASLLVVTLPVSLLAALAIRLDSPGPVFYRQERIGLYGESFMLLKFRSMAVDAETGCGPSWATARDPRVTRVGRFIRRIRIDELPQLLNVLRGEMSFIGPRPERPHFVAQLTAAIPRYHDRAFVKPGITGWAQINYPYGASVEDARMKLAYDLYYVKHRNLFLDLLILISTVRVILFQEGSR